MLKILNKLVRALKKVLKTTSFKIENIIMNGVILSQLIYLIPLWFGWKKYLLNSLQIIQLKAAHIVTQCGKRTPIRSLLAHCRYMIVAQLGVYHSLVLVYRILSTKSQPICPRRCQSSQASHNQQKTKTSILDQTLKVFLMLYCFHLLHKLIWKV